MSPVTGIDFLRRAVALFNNCRESFNESYSDVDLLKLADAYQRCGWDIPPDAWSQRQLREALRGPGLLPRWDEREQPLYPGAKR